MALGEEQPRRRAAAAGAESEGGGSRAIELGLGGGSAETAPAEAAPAPAPEVEGHEALEPSPLPSLRSSKSGSRKTRRLEWNVRDYTIKLPRKRTFTILRDIGAPLCVCGWMETALASEFWYIPLSHSIQLKSAGPRRARCMPSWGLRAAARRACWTALRCATRASRARSARTGSRSRGPISSTRVGGDGCFGRFSDQHIHTGAYEATIQITQTIGYVHQRELFFSHLSVREHLTFHAVNRMACSKSRGDCALRVEEVMQEVDLTRVAETQIGGGELYVTKGKKVDGVLCPPVHTQTHQPTRPKLQIKRLDPTHSIGLSGGERKRLNIATELLADPSTLLLDEPTSGLDSVMSELILLLLQTLAARPPKRIVITAIHAPSSRLFTLFTHLSLLSSDGRLCYWGPREELTAYFERLGYTCPPHFNPADFALELASTKVLQRHGSLEEGGGGAPETEVIEQHGDICALIRSPSSQSLVSACARHIVQQRFDAGLLEADNSHKQVSGVQGSRAPFWTR